MLLTLVPSSLLLLLFSCAQVKELDEISDHNDDPSLATFIPAFPATLGEYIDNPDDEDFYRVDITVNKRITIDLFMPGGKNYDLYLLNENEMVIDSSINNGVGGIESIRYTTLQSSEFYIKIVSGNSSFTSTDRYRLTIQVTDTSGFTSVHLAPGNPSHAAHVFDSTKNYLMEKPQYALSYNSSSGRPNWVAWQLNSAWLGDIPRQEDFRVDASLPAAWYHVNENDFSGSGYDRGHMCPSGDRTATETDNSETFLMTNMIAQAPDNNQGPWANLENYCRDLVTAGKELFVISGGYGSNGTIAGGFVSIPARTWKVVVVLNKPGISDVSTSTRVIGVDMPNVDDIRNHDWKTYRVSVDQIEAATGYDFMSNVSVSIQAVIESAVDNQ